MQRYIFFFFIFSSLNFFGQSDTINFDKKIGIKTFAVPATFIATGIFVNETKGRYGKVNLQNRVQTKVGDFSTKIENYLQYVPVAELYLADIVGVKARNSPFDQTKYLLISHFLNTTIVYTLKFSTHIERPSGKNFLSFPSGHTSYSFVNATVLYHEFKDTNKVLAYSGYLFSSATGILRVVNNKHWVSDVLVGAGVGILVTNLVYIFEPFKDWKIGEASTLVFPVIGDDFVGVGLTYFMGSGISN